MICLTNRHLDCPLFYCRARRKRPEHRRSEGETRDVAKCFSLLLELCALYSDRARSFQPLSIFSCFLLASVFFKGFWGKSYPVALRGHFTMLVVLRY